MALALFDFDGTIIDGDSDSKWNIFLIDEGLISGERYYAKNKEFYEDYMAGTLDIHEYQTFSLLALQPYTLTTLKTYKKKFFEKIVRPMFKKKALEVLKNHKKNGDTLVVITATSRFVVDYACNELQINNVIACEPEIVNDKFTGKILGVPSFREGKLDRLIEWKNKFANEEKLENAYYYGDSINDKFVLEKVGNPVVVDGDEQVSKIARSLGWKIEKWN